jgi:ATP-dependent protease Clp ATPase subunit
MAKNKANLVYCSFCGRTEQEVSTLIEGVDQTFICNHCITNSMELLKSSVDVKI